METRKVSLSLGSFTKGFNGDIAAVGEELFFGI